MKILSFGEIIWDVYSQEKYLGGAPLNFAAHVVKSGAEAYLLSAVGNDELGKKALEIINGLLINSKFIGIKNNKATGQCIVKLDRRGVPSYHIVPDVAYDYIMCTPDVFSMPFDALSFGTLALRSEGNLQVLKEMLKTGKFKTTYCDLNLRSSFYNPELVSFCIKNVRILKASETEIKYIAENILYSQADSFEELLKEICRFSPTLEVIILTCGENGSYACIAKDNRIFYCPAKKTKVVSTVGAGDCFGAVFLVNYLSGKNVTECLQNATERSAYVVSHFEAVSD